MKKQTWIFRVSRAQGDTGESRHGRSGAPALLFFQKAWLNFPAFIQSHVTQHRNPVPWCRPLPSDRTWELLIIKLTAQTDPRPGRDWATSTEQDRPPSDATALEGPPGAATVVCSGSCKRANTASPSRPINQVNCHWIKSHSDEEEETLVEKVLNLEPDPAANGLKWWWRRLEKQEHWLWAFWVHHS